MWWWAKKVINLEIEVHLFLWIIFHFLMSTSLTWVCKYYDILTWFMYILCYKIVLRNIESKMTLWQCGRTGIKRAFTCLSILHDKLLNFILVFSYTLIIFYRKMRNETIFCKNVSSFFCHFPLNNVYFQQGTMLLLLSRLFSRSIN